MNIGDNSKAQLKSLVERIENLDTEIDNLKNDKKELFLEAKDQDIDVKALRSVIRIRRQNASERESHESIVQQYLAALGDYSSTELGKSAISKIGG
jgi:uncharacterized protein (UPF0335 family)